MTENIGSSERDVERTEFVIEPTKQVDLRYRRILYEMDEDVTRVEAFIPTSINTTMERPNIDSTKESSNEKTTVRTATHYTSVITHSQEVALEKATEKLRKKLEPDVDPEIVGSMTIEGHTVWLISTTHELNERPKPNWDPLE